MANAHTKSDEAPHVVPLWKYFAVFAALLGLTGTTVAAAFVNLGPLSNAVALGIAMLKATLVALYFMHLRYSARAIPLVAVAGVLWLIHLLGGSFGDYMTRGLIDAAGR